MAKRGQIHFPLTITVLTIQPRHTALIVFFKPETNWLLKVYLLSQRSLLKDACLSVVFCVTSAGQLWRSTQQESLFFLLLSWSCCILSARRGSSCKWPAFLENKWAAPITVSNNEQMSFFQVTQIEIHSLPLCVSGCETGWSVNTHCTLIFLDFTVLRPNCLLSFLMTKR